MSLNRQPKLENEARLKPASSIYPELGVKYNHNGSIINYSSGLISINDDYWKCKYYCDSNFPEEITFSTVAEELVILHEIEKKGSVPCESNVYRDVFGRNIQKSHMSLLTLTALRVPDGIPENEYVTDKHGRKYWPRTILLGDQEQGDILVPEGNGRVVTEWDEVFGIPKTTSDRESDKNNNEYSVYFDFKLSPIENYMSGKKDVAVTLEALQYPINSKACICLTAISERTEVEPFSGLRPVKGLLPKIERSFL